MAQNTANFAVAQREAPALCRAMLHPPRVAPPPSGESVTPLSIGRAIELPDGGVVIVPGADGFVPGAARRAMGGKALVDALAKMKPDTLLNETALAGAFGVTTRTVRRMVLRGELPPAIRMAGQKTWKVDRVLAHIEARFMKAEARSERRWRS